MAMVELLTPTNTAAQSRPFRVAQENSGITSAVILVTGLTGAETADLDISHDGGTTWTSYNGKQATASAPVIEVPYPGYYRVDKGVTVAAGGVYMAQEREV